MQRILKSLAIIALIVGGIIGGTGAFFSDTETSSANVFTAGALDLTVDNESYYNLNKCTEVDEGVWQWQGEAEYPEPGTPCATSWNLDDLDNGHLFFDFTDVKPDDEGEDTISLHVQNDAWACMDVTLTSNDDVSSTEPELGDGDDAEDGENDFDGELAQAIEMFWWADDGDNVYEVGEPAISDGVETLIDLTDAENPFSVAIADAENNVWGTPGPLPGGGTVYLAKAWCFGSLLENPLPDDADTGPQERGTGFLCIGDDLDNLTQTDSATLDVVFRTEQARHNGEFLCAPRDEEEPGLTTITIEKIVEGGDLIADDFTFEIDAVSAVLGSNEVTPGAHVVSEVDVPENYTPSYGGDCDENGNITAIAEQNVTCTITNTHEEPQPGDPVGLFFDNFGTGNTDDTFDEAPTWEEGGAGAQKRNSAGGGDESISDGDGGRKAAMQGPDGYICRSINAAGYQSLALSYSWRGDSDAEAGDNGVVEIATGGTCAAPTGVSNLATHPLTTTTWQGNSVNLPGGVNNTTFLLRFRAASNAVGEDFRVDAVNLTGVPI